jgi:8-oxo-dGTP pyrophosphatase MutT (NUDIX family)
MGASNLFVEQIRRKLTEPLPGQSAQLRMAFAQRAEQLRLDPSVPAHAKIACVALILWQNQDDWHTILIQRTTNPQDRHSGQISFPGGKYDENDGNLITTALREVHEEIGVPPAQVEILGQLTELYIPVSNFVVYPFVGVLSGSPTFSLQAGEVEHIMMPPIRHFQEEGNKAFKELRVGTGVLLKDVPCYVVEEKAVWGATAMIISEFLELLSPAGS